MTKVQAHGLFWNAQQLAQHSANGNNLKLEHNYDYRSCQDKMRRRRMTLMIMMMTMKMMILRILGWWLMWWTGRCNGITHGEMVAHCTCVKIFHWIWYVQGEKSIVWLTMYIWIYFNTYQFKCSATVQHFQFQNSWDIDCMKTIDGVVHTDIVGLHHWYRSSVVCTLIDVGTKFVKSIIGIVCFGKLGT